jgi:hypothetical protein
VSKHKKHQRPPDTRAEFERLSITETDLIYAARFLKQYLADALYELEGPPRSVFADAFTIAIVVTYARPFTIVKDRHGKRETFDTSFLTTPLCRQQRGLHDRIVSDRNTIFAHSDARPKKIRVHDTPDGRITGAYDFCALEKRDAEELLAIVKQMQAALKPRLEKLTATVAPDR